MNADTRPPHTPSVRRTRGRPSPLSNAVAVLLLIALVVYAYTRLARDRTDSEELHATSAATAAPLAVPVGRAIDLGKACDGPAQCAQMTSCDESKYFLQNCPGVPLDSTREDVPCEGSWCSIPLAR